MAKIESCPNDCGAPVVWAPDCETGRASPFEAHDVDVDVDVWLLRRGSGMTPCSRLTAEELATLRARGMKGWKKHKCPNWHPGMKNTRLPGKIDTSPARLFPDR